MTYALKFTLPLEVSLASGATQSRVDALARFNDYCEAFDFMGITEGVLLAEEAHERGYETESWVLDAGEAPHERDWIGQEKQLEMIAYFKTHDGAQAAKNWLKNQFVLPADPVMEEQQDQDWNATWKASFTGIDVSESLRILPPWHEEWLAGKRFQDGVVAINPGAGFGTGTHETTQLCLRTLDQCGSLAGKTVLDFGSGSGILGITAALQGATVYCVEVDRLANDNAIENARLNGVESRVKILETIPEELKNGKVDILLANILRPILLQFSKDLKACLKPKAELILSGLIESDLDPVIRAYLEEGIEVHRFERNEWRALWFRRGNQKGKA